MEQSMRNIITAILDFGTSGASSKLWETP